MPLPLHSDKKLGQKSKQFKDHTHTSIIQNLAKPRPQWFESALKVAA
jgi:hypothetical protein